MHGVSEGLLGQHQGLFDHGADRLPLAECVHRYLHLLEQADKTFCGNWVGGRDSGLEFSEKDLGLVAECEGLSVLGVDGNLPVAHAVAVLYIDKVNEEIE